MTDQPAPLADCKAKKESFKTYLGQRKTALTQQESHAWELNALQTQQEMLEAAVETKKAECREKTADRDSLAELTDFAEAVGAAAAAGQMQTRLAEIASRLGVIWPYLTGDDPSVSLLQILGYRDEATDLLGERDELETDLAPHLAVLALYQATNEEIAALNDEIRTCDAEVARAVIDAKENAVDFEQRMGPYEIEQGMAQSALRGMEREQGRMRDARCDEHEGFDVPEIDYRPGVTFEDTLEPPPEVEDFDPGDDPEEVDFDDEIPDSSEYEDVPDFEEEEEEEEEDFDGDD